MSFSINFSCPFPCLHIQVSNPTNSKKIVRNAQSMYLAHLWISEPPCFAWSDTTMLPPVRHSHVPTALKFFSTRFINSWPAATKLNNSTGVNKFHNKKYGPGSRAQCEESTWNFRSPFIIILYKSRLWLLLLSSRLAKYYIRLICA